MDSHRTTLSGQGLTLITGLGGRPLQRREIESWYRTHRDDHDDHHLITAGPWPTDAAPTTN